MSFEIDDGPELDLLRTATHRLILGWVRSGCIAGVFLGTQCSSWSRARHGPPESGWCTIRSNTHIYGLPNFKDGDKLKVDIGNEQLRLSCHIIRTCCTHNVPCMLENPLTSMMWKAPCLASLVRRDTAQSHVFDQCQYGTPWRKAILVVSWNCGHCLDIDKRCHGKKGICSRTCKPHIILTGVSKQHKKLWTAVAQEYPIKLARLFARKLIDASRS